VADGVRLVTPKGNRQRRKLMSQIYRIEVAVRERAVASNGLPRFVVMVELSDRVFSSLGNPRLPELQLKTSGMAMNANAQG
jgi:hypothetical protein